MNVFFFQTISVDELNKNIFSFFFKLKNEQTYLKLFMKYIFENVVKCNNN